MSDNQDKDSKDQKIPRWRVIFEGGASDCAPENRPGARLLAAAPQFDPKSWQGETGHYKNCYSYVADDSIMRELQYMLQPGQASDNSMHDVLAKDFPEWMTRARRQFTEEEADRFYPAMLDALKKGAESDGMIPADAKTEVPEDHYLVALAITPKEHLTTDDWPKSGPFFSVVRWDYHWYRLDADGTWSHKGGGGTPRNRDEVSRIITCPETCHRGRYQDFVGYYLVPKGGLEIACDPEILIKREEEREALYKEHEKKEEEARQNTPGHKGLID